MISFPPLVAAHLLARPNRFLVLADVAGSEVRAACRDPGRMEALLRPGARLLLEPAPAAAGRATAFTLRLVRQGRVWVSAEPVLANSVFAAGVLAGRVAGFTSVLAREVRRGDSRLDFVLQGTQPTLVEVKSAAVVVSGCALFPDAPTARGLRHLGALCDAVRAGEPAVVVFVVQRPDAQRFAPWAAIDPAFAAALRAAHAAGVEVRAFRCRTSPRGVALAEAIPVLLSDGDGAA